MFQNSVVQITTGKLVGATLLPSSVLLVSGIIFWRVWRKKQKKLQAETNGLTDELRLMKEQMADLQKANTPPSTASADPPFSSQPQKQQKSSINPEKSSADMGLFEYLIEDNIQIRQ